MRITTQVSVVGRSYWDGHLFSVSLVLQEHTGATDAQNEQLDRNTPNLHSTEGGRETQGPGVQQPPETAPKPTPSGGQDSEDVHDPAHSGGSKGESWCSGYTVVRIDHH